MKYIIGFILFFMVSCYLKGQAIDINKLTNQANAGDTEAMFKLSCIYDTGCFGVPVDDTIAFKYAKMSADKGNVVAQCLVAGMFYRRKDFENHYRYLKRSAEAGYSYAQGLLGVRLLSGSGMKMNVEEGMNWLIMSAKSKNVEFQYTLSCYYDGLGECIDKDMKKCIYWLEKAAEFGHISAMNKLSIYYAIGYGVPLNKQICFYWCKRTAEAKVKDISCFDEEFLFAPDPFSEGIIIDAKCTLGKYYLEGFGTEKNMHKAAYWINKAKKLGSIKATELWNKYKLWEYLNQ